MLKLPFMPAMYAKKMLKIDQIQHYAMSRKGGYIAWGIAAIFILLILWKLYTSILLLVSKPENTNSQTGTLNLSQQTYRTNLNSLHIFGLYQPANVDPNQLPKSTLNIQLNGVFVAVPKNLSQAVLTVPGEKQKVYYEGEELPGNAKLYRILNNSVIIQYNGELQSLLLPEQQIELGTHPASLNLPKSPKRVLPVY